MLAATALYIPANMLPMMRMVELGDATDNTIIGGIIYFWKGGAYPIALVILTASIIIPLLKIVALSWLCLAASGKSTRRRRFWGGFTGSPSCWAGGRWLIFSWSAF